MLKQQFVVLFIDSHAAAAFGRLCVETIFPVSRVCFAVQPPSGGCVLKPRFEKYHWHVNRQPPSGGCVLKHESKASMDSKLSAAFGRLCVETFLLQLFAYLSNQPPSGGCVLKLKLGLIGLTIPTAAFGRLCVETINSTLGEEKRQQPPSGGCVLKPSHAPDSMMNLPQPPSGGCVLKQGIPLASEGGWAQPPSGGCVLKHYWIFIVFTGHRSRLRAAVC